MLPAKLNHSYRPRVHATTVHLSGCLGDVSQ